MNPSRKKMNISWIAIGVLFVVLIVVVVVGLKKQSSPDMVAAPAPVLENPDSTVIIKEKETFVEVKKVITSQIIEDGLRDMGFLITQEYYFTEAISYSSIKKFAGIDLGFTETSYLATYDGVITAGIDFTKIEVEKDDELKSIVVRIPASVIKNVDIDPESFVLYSEKSGVGNPLKVEDVNTSLVTLEATAREKAVARGLLTKSDEQAKTIIKNFVESLMDGEDFRITVIGK